MASLKAKPADSDSASIVSSLSSITSTEMFEHEPFVTFRSKVVNLCKINWPGLATKAFQISHMSGGSYNRVIGLQVDPSRKKSNPLLWKIKQILNALRLSKSTKQVREYVVRIPRYEHAWVEYEVAILLFLATTNVPAPMIKSFDLTCANPLGSPFTIQPRLPGRSVEEAYLDLNSAQRILFARSLGTALKELNKITSPCPGTLDPDGILQGSVEVNILRLQCPPRNATNPPTKEAAVRSAPMTVYDFIKPQLGRQHELEVSFHREHISPWAKFERIIDVLHARGLFENNMYYLTHMDLEPRNILVHITSPDSAIVSGILDWDESVFAPAFVSCRPPSWLWDFEGDDDEELDEVVAHVDPTDPDLLAVKRAFEDTVGEVWCRYAYETEYRLARDIVRLAITGMRTNGDYDVAKRVVREWDELKLDTYRE